MIDPVVYVMDYGIEKLREELEGLTEGELRKIVFYHHMDPTQGFRRWKREKLINCIVERAEVRSRKGDTFRNL